MASICCIATVGFSFYILPSEIFVLFIMYTTGSTVPREDQWQHLCNEKTQEV
jgi:F0F1-type ATP synthase assembly protein I